jgi:hypothetical protein
LLVGFLVQAERLGLMPLMLGEIDGYRVYFARPEELNPALPNILVMAGFHGNEPAGVQGLLRFMQQADPGLLSRVNVSFIPCLNPWGYEHGTRYGKGGGYTNGMYACGMVSPTESTMPLFERRGELGLLSRSLMLDLHESEYSEDGSYYLYSVGETGEMEERVKRVAGEYFRAREDGEYQDAYAGAEPYEVRDGVVRDLNDESWDWYVVNELGAKGSMVFETPSVQVPLELRISAQAAVIEAVLQRECVMDKLKIANELVKLAKELTAANGFTVLRPLKLKPEGGTSVSLENAKAILDAGYGLQEAIIYYDSNRNYYDTKAVFVRGSEDPVLYTFKGFSFGYFGQGSKGTVEFVQMFGKHIDEDRVYALLIPGAKGTFNLLQPFA